jgi:hypothetical protein
MLIIINLGTYATGGVSLASTTLQHCCTSFQQIAPMQLSFDGTLKMTWDAINSKMKAFDPTGAVEVSNGTDLSACGKSTLAFCELA